MPVGELPAGVEKFVGILADRFKEAVAGTVGGEVDGDERRAHELVENFVRGR